MGLSLIGLLGSAYACDRQRVEWGERPSSMQQTDGGNPPGVRGAAFDAGERATAGPRPGAACDGGSREGGGREGGSCEGLALGVAGDHVDAGASGDSARVSSDERASDEAELLPQGGDSRFGVCRARTKQVPQDGELLSLAATRLGDAWLVARLVHAGEGPEAMATRYDESLSVLGDLELPFELLGAFDPRILAAGDARGGDLLIADASQLRGIELDGQGRFTGETFELALPLLDPKARRVGDSTFVVGVDVLQGCGLFVRATIVAGSAASEPTMSECLSNFSGALRDAVVDDGGVSLLMGERLMRVDAAGEFTEWALDGSRYAWQRPAALGWTGDGGWLVAQAADGTAFADPGARRNRRCRRFPRARH